MTATSAAAALDRHERAVAALDTTRVYLAGVKLAREVTDAVGPRSFLHAGPPLDTRETPRACVGDRAQEPHEGSLFDIDAKYADVLSLDGLAELDRIRARITAA